MKALVAGLGLAALAASSGCGAHYVRAVQAAATMPQPQSRVTGHVLVADGGITLRSPLDPTDMLEGG